MLSQFSSFLPSRVERLNLDEDMSMLVHKSFIEIRSSFLRSAISVAMLSGALPWMMLFLHEMSTSCFFFIPSFKDDSYLWFCHYRLVFPKRRVFSWLGSRLTLKVCSIHKVKETIQEGFLPNWWFYQIRVQFH